MRIFFIVCAVVPLAMAPAQAFAWGMDGHRTVGAIADKILVGTAAGKQVKSLLKDGNLEKYAIWADCAKRYCTDWYDDEMRSYVKANPKHKSYHYTDIPIQEASYSATSFGADENDVVHILEQCIGVLRNAGPAFPNPHGFTRRQALILIAHLVGDIHQPLHVGAVYIGPDSQFVNPNSRGATFEATEGGNFLMLTKSANLHSYWDGTLVEDLKKSSTIAAFAAAIAPLSVPWKNTGDIGTWPKAWAGESLKLSAQVQSPLRLGPREMSTPSRAGEKPHPEWQVTSKPASYRSDSDAIAKMQLSRAGHRLAELLRTIWP